MTTESANVEERTPDRFDMGIDDVQVQHATLSREEQIRLAALHMAAGVRRMYLGSDHSVSDQISADLTAADAYASYIRGDDLSS